MKKGTLGEVIRRIREANGLNQKEFAKAIGATVSAVSNWENNRNNPNIERLKEIARLGNTTIEKLLEKDTPHLFINDEKRLDESISNSIKELEEEFNNLDMDFYDEDGFPTDAKYLSDALGILEDEQRLFKKMKGVIVFNSRIYVLRMDKDKLTLNDIKVECFAWQPVITVEDVAQNTILYKNELELKGETFEARSKELNEVLLKVIKQYHDYNIDIKLEHYLLTFGWNETNNVDALKESIDTLKLKIEEMEQLKNDLEEFKKKLQ